MGEGVQNGEDETRAFSGFVPEHNNVYADLSSWSVVSFHLHEAVPGARSELHLLACSACLRVVSDFHPHLLPPVTLSDPVKHFALTEVHVEEGIVS